MQFSAVLNIFIVKTLLISNFTNDLKRKENFSKNVQSYRVCSFNIYIVSLGLIYLISIMTLASTVNALESKFDLEVKVNFE